MEDDKDLTPNHRIKFQCDLHSKTSLLQSLEGLTVTDFQIQERLLEEVGQILRHEPLA